MNINPLLWLILTAWKSTNSFVLSPEGIDALLKWSDEIIAGNKKLNIVVSVRKMKHSHVGYLKRNECRKIIIKCEHYNNFLCFKDMHYTSFIFTYSLFLMGKIGFY